MCRSQRRSCDPFSQTPAHIVVLRRVVADHVILAMVLDALFEKLIVEVSRRFAQDRTHVDERVSRLRPPNASA